MNSKGLTIIESMIAMIILSILIVSISQFYQYTIHRNEREEQKSVASAMMEDYLELVKLQTLNPQKELILEPYRIVNGDTLYYSIKTDLTTEEELKEGTIAIVYKEDTLLRVRSLLLKEWEHEY